VRLGPAEVRFTGTLEGDLGHAGAWVERPTVEVEARRRAVLDRPWTWLRQVHGDRVVIVEEPGGGSGEEADAAVSRTPGVALAIFTADCAPVAFASAEGVIGAAHAGWRGLVAGVLEQTVDAMRALGASHIEAALGPCIHPECYEFGAEDLGRVTARLGHGVRGRTAQGRPALNVPAAVRAAVTRVGVTLVSVDEACTACSSEHFSYRARKELARQAMVVWVP
jgi:YfiH family protein